MTTYMYFQSLLDTHGNDILATPSRDDSFWRTVDIVDSLDDRLTYAQWCYCWDALYGEEECEDIIYINSLDEREE